MTSKFESLYNNLEQFFDEGKKEEIKDLKEKLEGYNDIIQKIKKENAKYFDEICNKDQEIKELKRKLKEAKKERKAKNRKDKEAIRYCEYTDGQYCKKHNNWYWLPEECIDCEHH